MNGGRLLLVGAVVLGCALMAEALWRGPFFPSNDGPHHVFGAYARAHIDDADKNYAAYLVANGPTSANGFADVFAILEPALGARDAERATLAIICAIFVIGAVLLAHALHPRRAWLGLVGGASALGWPLFLGFYEFVLASGLSFLVVVFGLRATKTAHRVALAALLLFLATVHFSVAFLAGGLLFLLRVTMATERKREALFMALVLAPTALVIARATGATDNHGDVQEVLPLSLRATALGACTIGGASWRQLLFALTALAGVALAAAGWRKKPIVERAFAVVALGGFLVPLVLPWTFLGWQHAAVRALPLCAVLALSLVPLEGLRPRAHALAAASCAVFFIAATWSARATLDRAAHDLDDVAAALETRAVAGYRLSVVTLDPSWIEEARLLRWDPLRGLGSLFAVAHGGLPAYGHVVSPQAHTVLVRADLAGNLPSPPLRSHHQSRIRSMEDQAARATALAPVIASARAFESVIAFERPEDHDVWKAAGFPVVAERGRVLLLAVPTQVPPATVPSP